MKTLILVINLTLFLVSCSTFQPITKKNKPITDDIQSKIRPGKTYLFSLRSGQDLVVRVEKIDSVNIYGTALGKTEYAYKDTYQSLIVHSTKISVKKFSPMGTVLVVVIPIALIGLAGSDATMDGVMSLFK